MCAVIYNRNVVAFGCGAHAVLLQSRQQPGHQVCANYKLVAKAGDNFEATGECGGDGRADEDHGALGA